MYMCLSVSVRVQDNSKNIEPINFIFGGGLLSDAGRTPFDFEKSVRDPNVGPNNKS